MAPAPTPAPVDDSVRTLCAQNGFDDSADDDIAPPSAPPSPPAPPAQRMAKRQAAAPESTPPQLHWMLHTLCGLAVGIILTLSSRLPFSSPLPTTRTTASARRPALLLCQRCISALPPTCQTTSPRQTTTHTSPWDLQQPTCGRLTAQRPSSHVWRLMHCALARFSVGWLLRCSSSGLARSRSSPRWLPLMSAAP